ncbi:hypothetical protein M8J77_001555 [Diaphorina citri]|nr:hypothetical protein M8J77_001555 [Diaphorina citri]
MEENETAEHTLDSAQNTAVPTVSETSAVPTTVSETAPLSCEIDGNETRAFERLLDSVQKLPGSSVPALTTVSETAPTVSATAPHSGETDGNLDETRPASRLKKIWSSFVTCEPNTYTRSCWFENVIHEVLRQRDDGIPGDTILSSFSTNSHVVSLIASEFLVDVHRVCSGSGEDDFGNLRKYLLRGRGAKCLAVLCALGVQDMSCSKEFTSLLISLQSAISLDSSTQSGPGAYTPDPTTLSGTGASYIPQREAVCLCSTLQTSGGVRKRSNEVQCAGALGQNQRRKKSSGASRRSRKLSRTSSARSTLLSAALNDKSALHPPGHIAPGQNSLVLVDTTSSDNEDSPGQGGPVPVKSQTLQVTYNALDFEYFTNVIHSGDEEEKGGEGKTKEGGEGRGQFRVSKVVEPYEQYRNRAMEEVVFSSYDFKVLTLFILTDLVRSAQVPSDLSISSIQSHPLLHILKFSLDYLSTLQLSTHLLKDTVSIRIKALLCLLIHTCLGKIKHNREFVKYIIQYHGILSTLIKIVEDVVSHMDNARLGRMPTGRKISGSAKNESSGKGNDLLTGQKISGNASNGKESDFEPAKKGTGKEEIDGKLDVGEEKVDEEIALSEDKPEPSEGVPSVDKSESSEGTDKGKDRGNKESNRNEEPSEQIIASEEVNVHVDNCQQNMKNGEKVKRNSVDTLTNMEKGHKNIEDNFTNLENKTNVHSLTNRFVDLTTQHRESLDAQWTTYLFNLTFTILVLYKHIIKYYNANEEKFNIFLQILNNLVNNKNINTTIVKGKEVEDGKGKDGAKRQQVIHELLLIKIARHVNNKHKMILFNLVNDLILGVQQVKAKLVRGQETSGRLNNFVQESAENAYHHVHILGHSYSLLTSNKCVVSNLNLIVISFLNGDADGRTLKSAEKAEGETAIGCFRENGRTLKSEGVAEKSEGEVGCFRESCDTFGAEPASSAVTQGIFQGFTDQCCPSDTSRDIDSNTLNIHIIKLLLNNGACCCFPHKILLNKIHTLLSGNDKKIVSHCFLLLENMLYKELNYYSGCVPCKYCDLVFVENNANLHEGSPSKLNGSPHKHDSNVSKANGEIKNNAKNVSNGDAKPKSSKFTITNILGKSKNTNSAERGSGKIGKNTNLLEQTSTSGNASTTSASEEKNRTHAQEKPKNASIQDGVKQSSIDEELLISFYTSILQGGRHKLKCKLLAHLTRVVNLFKSNLQCELVEHVIHPLFVKLISQVVRSRHVRKELAALNEKVANEELSEFIIVDNELNIISSDKLDVCTSGGDDVETARVVVVNDGPAGFSGTPDGASHKENASLSVEAADCKETADLSIEAAADGKETADLSVEAATDCKEFADHSVEAAADCKETADTSIEAATDCKEFADPSIEAGDGKESADPSVEAAADSKEGADAETPVGKKVVKRRRSRKNSEGSKPNVRQRSNDSKKKLTPKSSREKIQVQTKPNSDQPTPNSSKTNKNNQKTPKSKTRNSDAKVSEEKSDKSGESMETVEDSIVNNSIVDSDKLKNLNSNFDKAVFKASIEQTLETFEQTKKASSNALTNENASTNNEKDLEKDCVGKDLEKDCDRNETADENKDIEDFVDDVKVYEQNINLLIQLLTIIQNLTRQNKLVVKFLKKNNGLSSLNEVLLIENLTKLVCNILENFLFSSYDKRKTPTSLHSAPEEFTLLMANIRRIGTKLLTIINNTDDNLMNTIIFQTKSDQEVYLFCVTVLNALVKSISQCVQQCGGGLAGEEDVALLDELYESVAGVIVRYVFVEEFPQYKDSNHKVQELKLLETFIVFKTMCQEKASSAGGSESPPSAKPDENHLKQTLVTGINRRHFSLKQCWDLLVKCSIQSVCVNQTVKMNILQQHPMYNSDYESNNSSYTSTKSSPDNLPPSDHIHTSTNKHKCTILFSSHIITAIDIVLHYIVNNGRKISSHGEQRDEKSGSTHAREFQREINEKSDSTQAREFQSSSVNEGSGSTHALDSQRGSVKEGSSSTHARDFQRDSVNEKESPASIQRETLDKSDSQMSSSVVSSHQAALPNAELCSEHEILYCLQNVISMIKNNRENCLTLLRRNIVSKLLKYYFDFGSRNVRVLILNIVVQIGTYDLRSKELLHLIQLFKAEAVNQLANHKKLGAHDSEETSDLFILDTLQSLVTQHKTHPEFSMKLLPPCRHLKPCQLDLEPLSNKLSYSMMQSYDKNGMVSPWNTSAVCIPITCDLGWALWVQGISISFWYLLEETSTPAPTPHPSKPYHLLSIGYEGFLIEFYADKSDLIIRLTRPERNSYELLNEQTVPKCLRYNEYDMFCVSIKDTLQTKSKRVIINVDLVLNDNCHYSAALLFQGILIRKSRPMCILLGDKLCPSPTLSLTNLTAFRTPCLNQLLPCLILYSLGPSASNLTECEVGNLAPDLTRLVKYCMNNKLTYASYEVLLDKQTAILRHLQEHLLLIYSSRTPTTVALYPPALTTPTIGLLPSQPQGFFKALSQDTRPAQRFPIVTRVNIYAGGVQSERCAGLSTAVTDVAGLHTFLFLFARVVEIESCAEDQAKALDIVLKVSDLLSHSVNHTDYYPLIVQVLSTPRCKPSLSMLKVLFANMCGGSDDVITQSRESLSSGVASGGQATGSAGAGVSHALIHKPHILTDILLESWKFWSPQCLSVLFSAVYSLIKDEHPYREFNTMQLNRVHLLDRILLVCKQMYLYDDNVEHQYLLTPACCQVIVEIFRALMGTPPPVDYIELLVNFLLISHPATDAYISHARSAFYFLHSSVPPQLSEAPEPGSSLGRKFSTWHGRGSNAPRERLNPLAQPVDADSLSTALRNVQTTQLLGTEEGYGDKFPEFNRSTTNIDSGISGSLRENNNSVENNSQGLRSGLGLFSEPQRSHSGLFGSFRRNSLSQHYENLFFKKASSAQQQSSCGSTRHLMDSEDTVEETMDCLSLELPLDRSGPDEVDCSPAQPKAPLRERPETKGFNFGPRDDSPSLDLKLFDFLNKCRNYAYGSGNASEKRSPDKERLPPALNELEDTLEEEPERDADWDGSSGNRDACSRQDFVEKLSQQAGLSAEQKREVESLLQQFETDVAAQLEGKDTDLVDERQNTEQFEHHFESNASNGKVQEEDEMSNLVDEPLGKNTEQTSNQKNAEQAREELANKMEQFGLTPELKEDLNRHLKWLESHAKGRDEGDKFSPRGGREVRLFSALRDEPADKASATNRQSSPVGKIPTPPDVVDSGNRSSASENENLAVPTLLVPDRNFAVETAQSSENSGERKSSENPASSQVEIASKSSVNMTGILSQRSEEIKRSSRESLSTEPKHADPDTVKHSNATIGDTVKFSNSIGDVSGERRNVINLSENLTNNESIRKLLSELNDVRSDGLTYDGLSEHKRRSLIEIASQRPEEELRETRSVETARENMAKICAENMARISGENMARISSDNMAKSSAEKTGDESRLSHERIGGDQLTLIDDQRILNGRMGLGGDQTSVNGDQRRISCESGKSDELVPKIGDQRRPGETSQPGPPKDSKDILNDSKDILHSFGECNEEDIETSSLSGHEMLAPPGPAYGFEPPKGSASYPDSAGTMEQLFEAASKSNIMFNQSNLLQSKQEILLSALSISDIGADSNDEDDLESNLDDIDKILNGRSDGELSPPAQTKPQYVLNDGLIILLRDIILVLPDSMIGTVFNKIITLDILLILANHRDVKIRISLMKLIYSYLQRSSEDDLAEFMYRNKGFYLLSNQISLYPPSMDLANACVMFLTDCHWLPIQEQLNYIEQINLSPKQMSAVPLILSLLNISINKFHLCLQLLRFIEKLVKKMTSHNLNKVVNDYGLVQCLLKVLIKIAHEMRGDLGDSLQETAVITEYDVLLDTIDSILINVVTRIITSDSNVSNNTQMFNNIILYMTYVENIEVSTCGPGSKCYTTLKNIHRTLLEYTLDVIQDTITKQIYVSNQSVTNKIKKSLLSVLPSSHSSTYEMDDELSDSSSVQSYPASNLRYGETSYPTFEGLRTRDEPRLPGHVSYDSSASPRERDYHTELTDAVRYDARSGETRFRTYSLSQSMASRSIDSTMYNKRAAVRKYDKEKHAGASGKMMQKSELIERYKTIMSKCIDYIIYSECIYPMTVSETNFICHMLVTMLLSINSVIEKKNNTNYSSIMWNIRHTLRTKTSQLIIWILEPNRSTNLRIFLINTLRNEIYLKEILTNLFVNNNLEIKFILFLWELIYCCKLNNDDLRVCYEFEAKLKSIINHDIGNSNSKLNREVYIACKEFKAAQNEWVLAQMTHINKMILTRYEQLVRQITDTCIASTQQCLHRQNAVQKTLLGEIKAIYNKQLFTKDVWNRIILNLTHEKAPWYCEESYPKSWQLDDVEGPERIRIRQKRCHLYVHEKYLKPEYRAKTAAYKKEQPLEYLVKDSIKHESMIETIHTSESVTYMCCTHLITPSKQIQGELLITSAGLKFIPFNESHNFVTNAVTEEFSEHEQVMSEGKNSEEPNETGAETKRIHNAIDEVDISNDVNSDQKIEVRENLSENAAQNTKVEKLNKKTTTKTKKNVSPDTEGIVYRTDDIISVQFTNIKEIHNRRYNLQEKAIELFLINGKNYLFAFENHNDREHFLNELSTCNLPNRMSSDLLSDTIQLWREGHLTNWAYLMILNKMAGRSYNDLMQYPVLPFILSDYKSATLDLTDPKSFRNLKKPMAVQDKKNESHYVNNYNYLAREMCDAVGGVNQEPYHYGSHYSNSGTVLHFLVRIPPFTSMFLNYQDNNFDLPDRTFHNLATTWRLTSSESTTDVKELIPELFYLADILVNNEGFDFGVRQNGQRVDSVILPPWAPDPRTFIMVHRQSLESELVSENLPHWIDLVFGYKQSGKAAVDAINVFHPATYYGFDIAAIPDPLERTAWETMIRTYGQTPRQLFKSAHPMNVKKLTPAQESRVEVIPNIRGLVWGSYVGSPDEPPPCIVWKHKHRNPVSKLVPLRTNDVFGLAKFTTLLHSYHKDKNTNLISSLNVIGAGMICWNECDNLIRLKMSKELPATPVIRPPLGATIATATTAPDCHTLWLGLTSGNILVYEYELNASTNKIEFCKPPTILLGHSACVTDLYLCAGFSVAVSSSEDGTCLLWDINTIGYIREIPCVDPNTPVSHVTMSETNGEIASVLQTTKTGGSILRLHTINAQLITSLASELRITSVTFSNAPEGVSQNVIVTGHSDGTIQLWSGYKLAHLLTLNTNVALPVIAVTYSCDSQHLYASNTEGLVIIWESSSHNRTPKFLNLTLV